MREVFAEYRHDRLTMEPARLSLAEVAAVAADIRRQVLPNPRRALVTEEAFTRRCRALNINGVELDVEWQLDQSVEDDNGAKVLGATFYDPAVPGRIVLAINQPLVGNCPELMLSTAAHELAHAAFEGPAWVSSADRSHAVYRGVSTASERTSREWRANEFMGALLCPRPLLHGELVKLAASIGEPLRSGCYRSDLPILSPRASDAIVYGLAQRFGLSETFIGVRLQRYGLIAGV